jgi:hypothetical protein
VDDWTVENRRARLHRIEDRPPPHPHLSHVYDPRNPAHVTLDTADVELGHALAREVVRHVCTSPT